VHGEVKANTVYGNAQAGIYTDGASYVRVDGNLVYSNAKGIGVSSENPNYAAHDVWVYNNVVHDNQGAGIFIWDSSTNPGFPGVQNVIIANNTVVDNQISFYLAGSNDSALILNNLDYTTGTSYLNAATTSTFTFQSNITLPDLSGFVSPSTYNFQLNSRSPAINQGSPLPTFADDLGNTFSITVDYLGNPRVVGGAPDIGAYEYQG
jgi:parallel beta-helix repeat protein